MTTLAVYHMKGGVGKTTTAVNLAYLAAHSGAKTLLCDLDPQSSATFYFRVKPKLKAGTKGFRKGGKHLTRNIKGTDYDNLDLLPADLSHRHLALTFRQGKRSQQRLRTILAPLQDEYAYIFLDCPAAMTLVAENILTAADYVLVPVIPSTLSIRTYQQLVSFCGKKSYNTQRIIGFFSMVEKSKNMHRDIIADPSEQLHHMLYSTIPYVSVIEKMGLRREPVPVSAPHSSAAQSYQHLWQELQSIIQAD